MLILPIKKQWFDMIARGEKKAEYRAITPYYRKRFRTIGLLDENGNETGKQALIGLRNGYSGNAPTLTVRVLLIVDTGLPEWGAAEGELYYALQILDIISREGDPG